MLEKSSSLDVWPGALGYSDLFMLEAVNMAAEEHGTDRQHADERECRLGCRVYRTPLLLSKAQDISLLFSRLLLIYYFIYILSDIILCCPVDVWTRQMQRPSTNLFGLALPPHPCDLLQPHPQGSNWQLQLT